MDYCHICRRGAVDCTEHSDAERIRSIGEMANKSLEFSCDRMVPLAEAVRLLSQAVIELTYVVSCGKDTQ